MAIIAGWSIGCQLVAGIQERPLAIESNDGGPERDGDERDAAVGSDGTGGEGAGGETDASAADAPAGDVTAVDVPSDGNTGTSDADAGPVQPDANVFDANTGPHVGKTAFDTVSAGLRRTCGVKTDGGIACWGDTLAMIPAGIFLKVSVGGEHACALKTDNTIVCWGNNARGQATAPAGVFKAVTTGDAHSCGHSMIDGSVVCWGDNLQGQAAKPLSVYEQVSAGGNRTCLLGFDHVARCQGQSAPTQPLPAGKFRRISAGGTFDCGIADDATRNITCWNKDGTASSQRVVGAFDLLLGTGASHVCGVAVGGSIKCAGSNALGESTPPSDVFLEVTAGFGHTCAVRSDHMVVCWGDNGRGQAQPP